MKSRHYTGRDGKSYECPPVIGCFSYSPNCNIITFRYLTTMVFQPMSRTVRLLVLLCSLVALTLPPGISLASDRPKVVASLAPLELLVKAVAGDQVETATLVPAGASPHTYQLRPSERRQLAAADLVFWVGPGMENFLARLLDGPEFRNRSEALMPDVGDDHDHHTDHGTDSHHEHHHGDGEDPHVWLDPALALEMAETMVHHLAALENVDVAQLEQNLDEFRNALARKEAAIRQQLEPARQLELFTYHDAFRRFAEHYGLTIGGVLTLSPERTPGARHLAEVQQRLRQAGQACLLTEPQFNRQWWDALLSEVTIPVRTWDPLASKIAPSKTGYLEFQQSLADAVSGCLPEHAQQ